MLASSSRQSLKRSQSSLCKTITGSAPTSCRTAATRSTQRRYLSAAPQSAQLPQQDIRPNPASGLRHGPWEFTGDHSYQRTKTRTTLANYNQEILDAADAGRTATAVGLAADMKNAGIQPDVTTYNHLIKSAATEGLALEAWAFFEDMLTLGVQPNRTTFNHLIKAQSFRQSSYLWKTVDMMTEMGYAPDSHTYRYIIAHFTNSGYLETALQFYHNMQSQGIIPDLLTAQNIVNLAAQMGYPRLALDLVDDFEKTSARRMDPEVWANCLSASAEALYVDGVSQCWAVVVQELNILPDEGLCIEVLHTAARSGLPELVADVLRVLKVIGAEWHEHHFAPMIEAFCRNNQVKDALIALQIMRSSEVEPSLATARPIVDAIGDDLDVFDSTWAFIDEIHKEGKPVDITALNALVQASVNLGDLQRAVGTYKSFPEYGVNPNLDTFNFLLQLCLVARHRELGDKLLADMKEAKVKPNRKTFEIITLLCLTQTPYEDAFFYLEETKAQGFTPTQRVYQTLVLKCAEENDPRINIAIDEMRQTGYAVTPLMKMIVRIEERQKAESQGVIDNTFRRAEGDAERTAGMSDGDAQQFNENGGGIDPQHPVAVPLDTGVDAAVSNAHPDTDAPDSLSALALEIATNYQRVPAKELHKS